MNPQDSTAPVPEAAETIEAQIAQWRQYVLRRQAISPADVDELEDHLRAQVDDLTASGLDASEAFLVAIRRLGDVDAMSSEYAREHSDRMWKQLALTPAADAPAARAWVEPVVVIAAGLGAGIALKIALAVAGLTTHGNPDDAAAAAVLRTLSLYVAPFLIAYLGWKRRLPLRAILGVTAGVAGIALALALLPFTRPGGAEGYATPFGDTSVLAALHAPVILWALVGVAYMGGRILSGDRRMDFVRFTGEFVVYYALLALGGMVLLGIAFAMFSMVGFGTQVMEAYVDWILPICVPGAVLIAAWLVEAKQHVIENIAPVLTRVFTPLTLIMLLTLLAVIGTAGALVEVDRDLLILMDAVLILVLGLSLYAVSARDPLARPGWFDGLQLATIAAAMAVDAIMLTAMLVRIAEFGFSPNKTAALGLNLLVLVHLAGHAWLTILAFRGRTRFAEIARWHTRYLPLYAAWAVVVVVAFPLIFRGA
ncbi:permease prefix domain 1-containing protein [Microbacterium phosphatis]|uniref:permease prefix domain 1-containing protein n=1 Tax=Microbacterium phosphatis TaxID=3140248 RepID=UPI0031407F30